MGSVDEPLKSDSDARNRRTMLIVEDDVVLRMVLHKELEKNGFEVREAENGKAGLASIAEMHPDVIITDIEMPVMGGLAFMAEVRITYGRITMPIIAISASKSDGIAEKALAAGANQFFEKPLNIESFLAIVNRHLPANIPPS